MPAYLCLDSKHLHLEKDKQTAGASLFPENKIRTDLAFISYFCRTSLPWHLLRLKAILWHPSMLFDSVARCLANTLDVLSCTLSPTVDITLIQRHLNLVIEIKWREWTEDSLNFVYFHNMLSFETDSLTEREFCKWKKKYHGSLYFTFLFIPKNDSGYRIFIWSTWRFSAKTSPHKRSSCLFIH